jgi:hypothetical protein
VVYDGSPEYTPAQLRFTHLPYGFLFQIPYRDVVREQRRKFHGILQGAHDAARACRENTLQLSRSVWFVISEGEATFRGDAEFIQRYEETLRPHNTGYGNGVTRRIDTFRRSVRGAKPGRPNHAAARQQPWSEVLNLGQ